MAFVPLVPLDWHWTGRRDEGSGCASRQAFPPETLRIFRWLGLARIPRKSLTNLAGKLHKCGCEVAQIHALVRLMEEFVWSNGVDIET